MEGEEELVKGSAVEEKKKKEEEKKVAATHTIWGHFWFRQIKLKYIQWYIQSGWLISLQAESNNPAVDLNVFDANFVFYIYYYYYVFEADVVNTNCKTGLDLFVTCYIQHLPIVS